MPYIQIQDASGFAYRIDSTDWYLIRQWLTEILPRTVVRDNDGVEYHGSVNIHPMFRSTGNRDADWLADSRYTCQMIRLPSTDPDQVIAYLMEWRRNAEQELRELQPKGTPHVFD